MLLAPKLTSIEGVDIYGDDTLFYKFYPIAQAPSVRLDANKQPVFLLTKYAFSEDDRAHNPNLPAGGGYLNFDVQFDVAPDALERVRAQLQDTVNSQWSQYKSGSAQDQARQGVAGTTAAPKVEFGSPTWKNGKVSLDAPQAKELVSSRISQGVPSLLDGNIAVFSMDLTADGATFMQDVLLNPGGGGGSDLTTLQVAYDLEFEARIPPAGIYITADSKKIYDYVHDVLQTQNNIFCPPYDLEHAETHLESAITIQIDSGSSENDAKVIDALRQYALDIVKQLVLQNFFTNTPPDGTGPGGGTGDGTQPPDVTQHPVDGAQSVRYLKKVYDEMSMHIELHLEQSSVVNWPIHPQGTMETFFQGMSADQLKRFVRVISSLEDDIYKNLGLFVTVFADYEDKVMNAIEVDVRYAGSDSNGQHVEKNQTLNFTSRDAQTWSPALIGSQRDYDYRYRVAFQDVGFGPYSSWTTNNSQKLDIAVVDPGRVSVDVQAGNIDFTELVHQVQVTLAYEDADANVKREEYTVVLSASNLSSHYGRLIYAFPNKPVQYRTSFILQSGDVQADEQWHTLSGSQLLVNQSFDNTLKIVLLPVGDGWDDVVQVIVDVRYTDSANNYVVNDSFPLRAMTEYKTWKVLLKNKDKRDYEYQLTASLKNRFFQTDWKSANTKTLLVEVDALPRLKVEVMADLLDFTSSPLTEITLQYNAVGVNHADTLVFKDKMPQYWIVNVPANAPVDYTYQVTHNPVGQAPLVLATVHVVDHTVVVLPAYIAPKAGHISIPILPQLLDFSATPIVEVDLTYDDDANNLHLVGSFTLTTKDTVKWEIDVKDVNSKTFGYTITYFTADSQPHGMPKKYQDAPRIILPKYQPVTV